MRLLPRLHAGSDAYPGVFRFMRILPDFAIYWLYQSHAL
jgi:hypothetical protein